LREGGAVGESGRGAEKLQTPGGVGGDELFEKQPAEQPRQHAHRQEPGRQATRLLPSKETPPPGTII
jgi:hypothetical protein